MGPFLVMIDMFDNMILGRGGACSSRNRSKRTTKKDSETLSQREGLLSQCHLAKPPPLGEVARLWRDGEGKLMAFFPKRIYIKHFRATTGRPYGANMNKSSFPRREPKICEYCQLPFDKDGLSVDGIRCRAGLSNTSVNPHSPPAIAPISPRNPRAGRTRTAWPPPSAGG